MIVVEQLVPLNPTESLRMALDATRGGHPVVRLGLVVRRPGGPDTQTPHFTIEVTDVRRVAAALTAFADAALREAAAKEAAAFAERPAYRRGR